MCKQRLLRCMLQEQHIAEEMVAKAAAFRDGKDLMNEGQLLNRQQSRKQFSNPLPLLEMTPKVNYDYNQRRYNNPPNIGQAWSVGSFFFLHVKIGEENFSDSTTFFFLTFLKSDI